MIAMVCMAFGGMAWAGEPRWVHAEPTVTGGSLDLPAFLDTLDASSNLLVQCYERELRMRPDLTAKVMLKVVVASDGRVVSSGGSGLGGQQTSAFRRRSVASAFRPPRTASPSPSSFRRSSRRPKVPL